MTRGSQGAGAPAACPNAVPSVTLRPMLAASVWHITDESIRSWGQSHSDTFELFLRLVLAIVAGGLVGLERELRGRQAWFRTTILVCLGSALVMVVSVSF